MSTNPQLDLHPDAESLNAFAERLLPDHERPPILAHLASCARCRQILFLAQDSAERETTEEQQPAPAGPVLMPSAKKQPANWRVAWGALAACVALATLSIVLYPRHPATAPEQAKIVPLPQAPPATPPVAVPPASENKPQSPAERQQPRSAAKSATANSPSPVSDSVASPNTSPKTSLDSVILAAPAKPAVQQPAPQQQAATGSSTVLNITLKPASASQTVEVQAAPMAQSESTTVNVSADNTQLQPTTPPLTETMSAQAIQPTDQLPLNGRNLHALGAMKAPAQAATHGNAVGYGIGAGMAGGIAGASAKSPAPSAKMTMRPLIVTPEDESAARATLNRSLPSGLPAVSAVSASHHLLALDATGALFLSEDSGAIWEPISQPWTGRAIHISISRETTAQAPEIPANALAQTPSNAAAVPSQPTPAPARFEIVTEKGVSWTSADGRIWTTKGQKPGPAR